MTKFNVSSKDYLNPKQLESEFGFTIGMQNQMRMRKNHGKPHAKTPHKIHKKIQQKIQLLHFIKPKFSDFF